MSDTDNKTILRFVVCSDTHINGAGDEKLNRIEKMLNFAYEEGEKDIAYPKIDACVFVGDVTDRGTIQQFDAFEKVVKSNLKSETKILAIAARNHDSWDNGKVSLKRIAKITKESSTFHCDISGFHFIGISTSKYKKQRYGLYQYLWLSAQLKSACKTDKPVFIFQHEHVRNTVYGSSNFDGWGVNNFKKLYKKYQNIIHFSGHSHYPLNDPRSVWQGKFTAFGTGAMSYAELTVENERKVHPDMHETIAQAWIVEVKRNNAVTFKGIDAINSKILCQYNLKSPFSRELTKKLNESNIPAPSFDESAKIAYDEASGEIIVPCAKEKGEAFLYRMEVFNKDGRLIHNEKIINDYWLKDCYEEVKFSVSKEKGYTVKVYAENAYLKKSSPLILQF